MNLILRFLSWLGQKVWCEHKWRYLDTVKDQDLRSGHEFWSARYTCGRCGRVETREQTHTPLL
jgi:hypothetical protein